MSKQQLHKRFSTEQVIAILKKCLVGELTVTHCAKLLGIGRTRFYQLFNQYKSDAKTFSIDYDRQFLTHYIDEDIEKNIIKELKIEKKKIIDNPNVPTDKYNYSYIKNLLHNKYNQKVSVNTIIGRAKENGFYKPKRKKKKIHDREIISNYVGELLQHDSSHHLFAPDANQKWYPIDTLDDYSRLLLYADLFEKETTWNHIFALQNTILKYGTPLSYYMDQHSIFRYVKGRDKNSYRKNFTKFTDDIDPQFKQVLKENNIKPTYALSPQAKGKVERSYRWLQDHLVRTCAREGVTNINDAREILLREVIDYNTKRIHSTTGEIPIIRFKNAIKQGKTLFRDFKIPKPFHSIKDVFCLRATRIIDPYRRVSIKGKQIKVPKAIPRQQVELRFYPDFKNQIIYIRFWIKDYFMGEQKVKMNELDIFHF